LLELIRGYDYGEFDGMSQGYVKIEKEIYYRTIKLYERPAESVCYLI
jgi:hypothetical protein